jgi:speckle-type POZ protein
MEAQGINDYNKEMFETGRISDVTIKTKDNKEIKAHSFILSRSKVFNAMLNAHNTKEAQQKTIKIEDISFEVLNEMIGFMYYEKAPRIEEMAIDLLIAADKYDVPGLVNKCIGCLSDDINKENFSKILITAEQMHIQFLKDAAINFIIENRKEICKMKSWDQLTMENMELSFEVIDKFTAA